MKAETPHYFCVGMCDLSGLRCPPICSSATRLLRLVKVAAGAAEGRAVAVTAVAAGSGRSDRSGSGATAATATRSTRTKGTTGASLAGRDRHRVRWSSKGSRRSSSERTCVHGATTRRRARSLRTGRWSMSPDGTLAYTLVGGTCYFCAGFVACTLAQLLHLLLVVQRAVCTIATRGRPPAAGCEAESRDHKTKFCRAKPKKKTTAGKMVHFSSMWFIQDGACGAYRQLLTPALSLSGLPHCVLIDHFLDNDCCAPCVSPFVVPVMSACLALSDGECGTPGGERPAARGVQGAAPGLGGLDRADPRAAAVGPHIPTRRTRLSFSKSQWICWESLYVPCMCACFCVLDYGVFLASSRADERLRS